jgi:hypothetical protein
MTLNKIWLEEKIKAYRADEKMAVTNRKALRAELVRILMQTEEAEASTSLPSFKKNTDK